MTLYIVGYDLKSGQDYKPLTDYLRTFDAHWHCLDSTWIVETTLTAKELRDQCWGRMYSNDKLLVVQHRQADLENGCPSAWIGFNKECGDWLKNHM